VPRVLQAEVVVRAQCELAEGPVWDAGRGLLRWVDILAGHVHAYSPVTGAHTWFSAGDPVGTVGLTRSGGLVLALVDGFALTEGPFAVRPADGPAEGAFAAGPLLTRIDGFATDRTTVRFNDGKPDPWGNFCAGTMPWIDGAARGSLYRLSPDGSVRVLIEDVGLSNGLDWSDDLRLFYYADSRSGGVDAFATDRTTGALGARYRFVTVSAADGVPDGLTLDADGCLWLAVFGAGELRRYTPAGVLDTVVRLPVSQVTSAAFGAGGVLYITTARENFTAEEIRAQPHAGDIFCCMPGVEGRPAFRFTD
jgi:sugar lactone lactonase YvrE